MTQRKIYYVAACYMLIAVSILLCSCAGTAQYDIKNNKDVSLIWPPHPSKPRIEYLGSVSGPEDLGIKNGFFGFLRDVVFGEEDNNMVQPMDAVANQFGQLFVADSGKKIIHRFDRVNGKYTLIQRENDRKFASPVGLATDKSGNVFVVDSDLAKVFIIPVNAEYATPLPLDGNFVRPTGIACDKDSGRIYVVDAGMHAVYIFNEDNSLVKKFGTRGTDDGQFNFPTYIWQNPEGRYLVTDSLNFRIQIFDRYGRYLSQFGKAGNATGDLARPKGVAQDSHGHVYVTDSLFHNIQVFDESGGFLLDFGVQGTGPGEFWLPVGIFISQDDTIYVADSYNHRIQMFRYIGKD